jgi:RES domain-containing protein
VIVWRISNYASLDGTGGVRADGRWSPAGRPVVYCALHPATALVETFVHQEVDASGLPSQYRYLRIEIPDGTAAEEVGASLLAPGWEADEVYTRSVGDAWLAAGGTALLYVPSVIVPETQNVLVNPRHRDAAALRIVEEIAFRLDRRPESGALTRHALGRRTSASG